MLRFIYCVEGGGVGLAGRLFPLWAPALVGAARDSPGLPSPAWTATPTFTFTDAATDTPSDTPTNTPTPTLYL